MEKQEFWKNGIIGGAVLALLLAVIVLPVAAVTPTTGADLIFLSSEIDPVSASPGGDVNFNVITQNWGITSAENVTIGIVLPDDLILKDSAQREQRIAAVCSLCNFETKYSMKVSERAVSGEYKIKIVASWNGGSRDKEFEVSVKGTPKLSVTKVEYLPAQIEPGKQTQVTLVVRNIGSAPALNGAIGLTIPTLEGDTKPRFAVINSGTEIPVGTLGIAEERQVSFVLAVDKELEAGVYNFPLNLSYSGTTSSSGLGLMVVSSASLTLPKVQTDPVTVSPGKPFLLSATVENIGKNDAKSVTVQFVTEDPRFSGSKNAYLGTINSGDKDVALFEMTYSGGSLGTQEIPVAFLVKYSDDFGEHEFTEKGEISAEGGLAKKGASQGILSTGFAIAVIAALVIGGFFLFRMRKGKKRPQQ